MVNLNGFDVVILFAVVQGFWIFNRKVITLLFLNAAGIFALIFSSNLILIGAGKASIAREFQESGI
jgi:hypothetical protein